jgi:ArsR family transcriptional regulator
MKTAPRQKTGPHRTAPSTPKGPPLADADLALLAKALGHPVRVAILRHLLRHGECICGALVDLVPLAQSTVSQHLKVLKRAGLLQGEIDGPRVCYCANRDRVRRLQQLVGDL